MKEITRLVVRGWPSARNTTLIGWLHRTISQLKDRGESTKFLITPGGFSLGKFPAGYDSGKGWDSQDDSLDALLPNANKVAQQFLASDAIAEADGVVRYLTLNVDLRSLASPLHAELIALIDVAARKVVGWTGKSYPTMCQEHALIHVTDPKTHLFKLGDDRVVVLGCHDLNVFNGRARANQKPGGNRRLRSDALREEIEAFDPTHILQHPHGTDTWRSWNQPWKAISRQFPNSAWASGITYASASGKCRAPIGDVLGRTHYEGSSALDVVIRGRTKQSPLQADYVPAVAGA